jgi:O-succinylbenzoic acid--CoA ligase
MRTEGWLARAAARRPGHTALVCDDGECTYAELDAAATAGARRLAALGVLAGDRVALALAPGRDFVETFWAVLRCGAVVVPIDPRLGAEDRAAQQARCALTVAEPLRGERDETAVFAVDQELDAPAVVVHTSGTTTAPRPVDLTYGNWLWSALGSAAALGHPADERWLCTLPLSHVGGLSILVRSVIAGTIAVVRPRFDAASVAAELMAPDGPTIVSLVPTTLARTLDAGLDHPPRLRWALLGGAPIPPVLLERAAAAGVPVAPTYGLTETCSQVATFGVPLFCTRVALAPDGEILVQGPTVAGWTAEARPVLHTGDLGAWDADGRLQLVGRAAETIISGGENVAPAEVEAVLEAHPGVLEAGVRGRPDPEWGEAVVAVVVPRAGAAPTADELRAWCGERLARYKVPKAIVLADALPRTASGKLRRTALPER